MRWTHNHIDEVVKTLHAKKNKDGRYRRVGECVRCGACCAFEDPPCEHFTPATDTEPASCAIWDSEDRDVKCKEWPVYPPVKIKTCGFRFEDKLEGDKELDLNEA
jgi:hypothetical protein